MQKHDGFDEARRYQALCEHGNYFHDIPAKPVALAASYEHPERGTRHFEVDPAMVARIGTFYTGNASLATALGSLGATVKSLGDAFRLLEAAAAPIWGVSGYASSGFRCAPEAQWLMAFYQHLRDTLNRPPLVTDGGMGMGVLGLNGMIASADQLPTLGFAPYGGTALMSPRTHMVITQPTYRARQPLVGLGADILLCLGGGEGAARECIETVNAGGYVVLAAPQQYRAADALTRTYREYPALKLAEDNGQLIVSQPGDHLSVAIGLALERYRSAPNRTRRLRALRPYLPE